MNWNILALTFQVLAVGQETNSLIALERQYRNNIQSLELAGPSTALSNSLNGLAALYFDQRDYRRAELFSRRSLLIEQALPVSRELELARRLNNIAAVCTAQGNTAEAARLIRQSLEIYGKLDADADQAIAVSNLGILELKAHQNASAASHFEQAVKLLANDPADLAKSLANLAEAQSALGRTDESIESWTKALRVARSSGASSEHDYGAMLCLYSKTLARAGRKSQSQEIQRRGRAILNQSRPPASYTVDRADFR